MSTSLKSTPRFYLTQFAGPDNGTDDRRKLQVTHNDLQWDTAGKLKERYIQVTREEALDLAVALIEWAANKREESDE